MTKEQFLTKENLVNILSDATYGNSYVSIKRPSQLCEQIKLDMGKDKYEALCIEDLWAEILLRGGKLCIVDLEDEDDFGNCTEKLAGLEDFGTAFEKWRDERPQDYADFCTGHGDFYTGWSFIQYVQFGRVVYR